MEFWLHQTYLGIQVKFIEVLNKNKKDSIACKYPLSKEN